MPTHRAQSNCVPTYQHHRASGRAFTYIRDDSGERRRVYLGKWNSPESHRRYREGLFQNATVAGRNLSSNASIMPL